MPVLGSRVHISEASHKTLKRRIQTIKDTRMAVDINMHDEVKVMPKQSRQEPLKEVGLPFETPVDHCLAMKASLSTSWNKLRTLRRSAVIVIMR